MTMRTLAELTTMGVGGPALNLIEADSEADVISAVDHADQEDQPLLILGGGSNIVMADAGFPGVVVRDMRHDITIQPDGVSLVIAAGTPWRAVVDYAVENGLSGIEALSGIPGSTGATPVQNVGAYGQDISQTISSVRAWDRNRREVRRLTSDELAFDYRSSLLKQTMNSDPDHPATRWFPSPRYVVLDVTFQLESDVWSQPVRYPELARVLGIEVGGRAPLTQVRDAVLKLRSGKGMVVDPTDSDTRSAGSFFTNPVLVQAVADALPVDAPRFMVEGGLVKTSAAWLIEHAGIGRGYGLPGPAAVSTKHVLALTNRGGATTEEVLVLARAVRDAVADRFGIELVPEPVLIGCAL